MAIQVFMASKAKFLFDMPFDGTKPRVERSYAPKAPPPKFSAEEIEATRAAAYAEGEAAGRAEAYGDHQRNLEHALQAIESQLAAIRSEEHTSELQSLMRISYAVFCLKKKKKNNN